LIKEGLISRGPRRFDLNKSLSKPFCLKMLKDQCPGSTTVQDPLEEDASADWKATPKTY